MSAWVCSKAHIDLIVSGLREFEVYITLDGVKDNAQALDAHKLGKMLWAENVKSVAYRYGLANGTKEKRQELTEYNEAVEAYEFQGYAWLNPGPLARIMDAYAYQSCEHPEWEASEARQALASLYEKLCEKLPDYDKGPWGVDTQADIQLVSPLISRPELAKLPKLRKPR